MTDKLIQESSGDTNPEDTATDTNNDSSSTPARKSGTSRLFIGNLDRRIREIHILKLFKKFGEIKALNFMFHKHGPFRGEPRGYMFLEYASEDEAERAIREMHGKMALGRRLVVSKAVEKSPDDYYTDATGGGGGASSSSSVKIAAGGGGLSSSSSSYGQRQQQPSSVSSTSTFGASTAEKKRAVQSKLDVLEREQEYGEPQHQHRNQNQRPYDQRRSDKSKSVHRKHDSNPRRYQPYDPKR